MEGEDLENNPVLRTIQSKQFEGLYKWIQEHKGLICVPHSRRVKDVKIDRDFIELHSFRPSALLKDNFVSCHRRRNCSVIVEGKKLLTVEGYPDKRTVNIIAEEDGYGMNGEVFKIVLIDGPLVGSCSTEDVVSDDFICEANKKWTSEECVTFLHSFTECLHVLGTLDNKLEKFCKSYGVVEGYLHEAVQRLKTIWEEACQEFFLCVVRPYSTNRRFQNSVYRALDSYVMKHVHQKVFPVVCAQCEAEDTELTKQCQTLSNPKTIKDLLHLTPNINYKKLVRQMLSINECICPWDKLLRLKDLLDQITEEVNSGRSTSSQNSSEYLTSDDYISIVGRILVMVKGSQVMSNLYYMENFCLYQSSADSLSFSLVTLRAASTFILNFRVEESQKRQEEPSAQNSTSEQLNSRGNHSNQDGVRRSSAADSTWRRDLCRELDVVSLKSPSPAAHITRTVSDSSNSSTKLQNGSLSSNRPANKQENSELGEFLSALKADCRPVSYGKQT